MQMTALMVSVSLCPLDLAFAARNRELNPSSIPLGMRFFAQLTTPAQCRLMVLATSTIWGILLWVGCWRL